MRNYGLQGAIGWLVAGAFISWLYSITEQVNAWWIMLVVSPFVIGYSIVAIRNWND